MTRGSPPPATLPAPVSPDPQRRRRVSTAVMTTRILAVATLCAALCAAGCGGKDKQTAKSPGSSGTVSVEGTQPMDGSDPEGTARPGDTNAGDPDNPDRAPSSDDTGRDNPGDGVAEPEPPKIEPPDLDISAQREVEAVRQHLSAARSALTGAEKDPNQAIAEARSALAVDPANVDAVALMAHGYVAKGLLDTAEVMLDMAFKERKKAATNPSVYFVYGLIYDATNRPERALLAYEKAVEFAPEHRSALINLGVHYLRNKRFVDAISIYERLINQLNLKTEMTWSNMGSAYRGHSADYPGDSGRRADLLQQAETAYKKAISLNRNYANAYYNLGLLYLDADPFPGPDGAPMDKLARLTRAKTYFDEYSTMKGADRERVAERQKEVKKLINREEKRRKRGNKKSDDDW